MLGVSPQFPRQLGEWHVADAALSRGTSAASRQALSAAPAASASAAAAAILATAAAARFQATRRGRRHLGPGSGPSRSLRLSAQASAVVEVETEANDVAKPSPWHEGLKLVPPPDLRARIRQSRTMVGKTILAYMGDAVWEFAVLRSQYKQGAKSPFTESWEVRFEKQAKLATYLYNSDFLRRKEKAILRWGTSNTWRWKAVEYVETMEVVGHENWSTARGLCTLLGYIYLDAATDDSRLEVIFQEIGLLMEQGYEDRLLEEVCGGVYKPPRRLSTPYFLALQPLGHVALRMYIGRYLLQRAPRSEEFKYRVQMALRQEELDLAAVGFMRDDATPKELALMKAARDQNDSYAFAFECLLGYLALTTPYRLHQIISTFGFTSKLPGT